MFLVLTTAEVSLSKTLNPSHLKQSYFYEMIYYKIGEIRNKCLSDNKTVSNKSLVLSPT